MSMTVIILVSCLVAWMALCVWCGFYKRFVAFVVTVILGLAMNMAWMMIGLNARPLEAHALMAEMSVFMYGVAAFGMGWLAGRLVRQFKASSVE